MRRQAQTEPSQPKAIRLRTLGGLALDGSSFRRPKPLLLLAYLALEGPQDRRHLAELFWPRAADHLKSLTVALAQLKQGAPGTFDTDGRRIKACVTLDATQFCAVLDKGHLGAAFALYRGPFLDGVYLSDWGEELEEWVYGTRERLAGCAREAMLTLAERDAAAGDLAAAARHAETAYRLKGAAMPDPPILERLYRLLLASGSPYAAEVREEAEGLGVDVTITTDKAKDQLLGTRSQRSVLATLPTYATPFIGRKQEVAELERLLLDEPACRLVTLVGPGGMGKTRLATEVARTVSEAFPDGVFFVPLMSVSTPSGVVSAVAEALEFRFYRDVPPERQLVDYLREKKLLLLLDNFEQLTEHAGLVAELLGASSGSKILVTTRESLHLQEEWVFPLEGLSFPQLDANDTPDDYDAVRLFEACARRAHVRFPLEAKHALIVRLCGLVEGTPLALELAASWLRVLPLERIVRDLAGGVGVLTARQHGVPERHRSMRAVLEGSWELLDDEERAALKRLSVFRGGFRRGAAEEVAGASLEVLASLVEKSLLKVTESGRYGLHELLRQFATEKLAEDAASEREVQARHHQYFLAFLRAREESLTGRAQRRALDEISEDLGNVGAYWERALERGDIDAVADVLNSVYHFCQIRSRYLEGEELFAQAVMRLWRQDLPGPPHQRAAAVTRVLAKRGAFRYALCDYGAAERDLQASLVEARALGLRDEMAFLLNVMGQLAAWQGRKDVAEAWLSESLSLCRALGDKHGAVGALEKLASLIHATFGAYEKSKELAAQSLALSRELGRPDLTAYALDTLGFSTFCLGEYANAEAYYRESLALFAESGDPYGTAMATGGTGLVLWAMGGDKTLEATAWFEKSLDLCRAIGNKGQVMGRLAGLARVANDLGQHEKARDYALEGLSAAPEVDSPIYLAHLLCGLGEAAYRTGQLGAARDHLTRALRVTSEAQLLAYLAMALYHYAALLAREGEAAGPGTLAKLERASELACLVSHHPACWHVYKERAAQLREDLEKALPADRAAAARVRGEAASLKAMILALGRGDEV